LTVSVLCMVVLLSAGRVLIFCPVAETEKAWAVVNFSWAKVSTGAIPQAQQKGWLALQHWPHENWFPATERPVVSNVVKSGSFTDS
jgi:hypothetical protein